MRKNEIEVRKKMVVVRLNDKEFEKLQNLQNQTTDKYLSDYLRKVLLQKPILVKYRNQSADDFLRDMLELKKQLNAIGNNLNQAVRKLHMLEKIPEFRLWLLTNEPLLHGLNDKISEVKSRIAQLNEQLRK
jgi:hypothetical protein